MFIFISTPSFVLYTGYSFDFDTGFFFFCRLFSADTLIFFFALFSSDNGLLFFSRLFFSFALFFPLVSLADRLVFDNLFGTGCLFWTSSGVNHWFRISSLFEDNLKSLSNTSPSDGSDRDGVGSS